MIKRSGGLNHSECVTTQFERDRLNNRILTIFYSLFLSFLLYFFLASYLSLFFLGGGQKMDCDLRRTIRPRIIVLTWMIFFQKKLVRGCFSHGWQFPGTEQPKKMLNLNKLSLFRFSGGREVLFSVSDSFGRFSLRGRGFESCRVFGLFVRLSF